MKNHVLFHYDFHELLFPELLFPELLLYIQNVMSQITMIDNQTVWEVGTEVILCFPRLCLTMLFIDYVKKIYEGEKVNTDDEIEIIEYQIYKIDFYISFIVTF